MLPPEYRFGLLFLGAIIAGVLLGAALIHKGWARAFGAILAGHVFASIGLYLAAQRGADMLAMSYMIIFLLFALPATLGMALGGGGVWLWQRKRKP